MKIGVCTSLSNAALAADAGADFLEEHVQKFLMPQEDVAAAAENIKLAASSPIPVTAANCFLPGSIRSTGPDLDTNAVVEYAVRAFERANKAGIETIVFGSGRSRSLVDGFDKTEAEGQIVELLKVLGLVAEVNDIILVLEPLNSAVCNFINSLEEAAALVSAASHPSVKLLADIYHMARDGEKPTEISKCGRLLHHVHIAEAEDLTSPGTAGDDFTPYFAELKKAGYNGSISIECKWKDFQAEVGPAIKYLRGQLAEVGL